LTGIGVILLGLTVVGVATGADPRLVTSDAIGTVVTFGLAIAARGREQHSAIKAAVVAVTLIAVTFLAVSAHARPWLLALTLAAMFAFGFVSLTGGPSRIIGNTPPRPSA
jgi:hypothetical protein